MRALTIWHAVFSPIERLRVRVQALFDWWQYRLCDVFIELVKPVMTADESSSQGDSAHDSAAEKAAFRETLWVCLDTGLRCVCLRVLSQNGSNSFAFCSPSESCGFQMETSLCLHADCSEMRQVSLCSAGKHVCICALQPHSHSSIHMVCISICLKCLAASLHT